MSELVELRNVLFSRGPGTWALNIPEFTLAAGERVACVGGSGSGKTTLIHLIAGILQPSSGVVRVGALDLINATEAERRSCRLERMGLIFQDFALLDSLTALENVMLPLRVGGRRRTTDDRARALLSAAGLERMVDRKPERLSHGERQRVAICRALVTDPSIVLGDEPTGNLDPRTGRRVLDLLFQQVASHRCALLMVTHDHALSSRFDRVVDVTDFGATP